VTKHGPGIAQAKIDILIAIHIFKTGPLRLLYIEGEGVDQSSIQCSGTPNSKC
jgi:hypothetical protein